MECAAEGSVTVANVPVTSSTRLRPGDALVTGDGSSASVKVGSIGEVQLGAGSVIRLESADATGHRFALERGEVHARIWAKPRFFQVATARVRAIDLGCVYTLRVDERGAGSLEVYYGAVELVDARGTTFVPAGNAAGTDTTGQTCRGPSRAPGVSVGGNHALVRRTRFAGAGGAPWRRGRTRDHHVVASAPSR
jgi:hypothetical protein